MQDDSDKMLAFELEQMAQGGPLAFNKATILEAIDRLSALLAERDEIEAMNQQQALRLMEQESARIAAEAKLDAVTRDAERYRWLRDMANGELGCGLRALYGPYFNTPIDGIRLDAAIDHALADQGRAGEG